MCPNCHKNTFSALDKLNWSNEKPMVCNECGVHVKPTSIHFFISFNLLFVMSLGSACLAPYYILDISIYPFPKIESIIMGIELFFLFCLGLIIPVPFWIKINDWFVPLQLDTNA